MKENWIGKELDLDLCWRTNLIVQITLAQKPGTKRIFEAFTTEIFSFNIRVFCQIEQISNLGFRFEVYLDLISSLFSIYAGARWWVWLCTVSRAFWRESRHPGQENLPGPWRGGWANVAKGAPLYERCVWGRGSEGNMICWCRFATWSKTPGKRVKWVKYENVTTQTNNVLITF